MESGTVVKAGVLLSDKTRAGFGVNSTTYQQVPVA